MRQSRMTRRKIVAAHTLRTFKMQKHYPPKHKEPQFHCIHCGVYAAQHWGEFYFKSGGTMCVHQRLDYNICQHCNDWSYWFEERMIVPGEALVPPHHEDLPSNCIGDYDEARDIAARSPKAAAALIRLCIQKLMVELGQTGKNINDDIGALVKAGLPIEVQRALDYCRVIGNNAVHPGEIDFDDDPSITHTLFEMVNFVVEDRITKPKTISDLYKTLPEGAIKAVEGRDSKKSP